jgi:hypothetical protein
MNLRPKAKVLRRLEGFYFGLVLWFFHRSAMIGPVSARSLLVGTGGGWIVLGLVSEDRF